MVIRRVSCYHGNKALKLPRRSPAIPVKPARPLVYFSIDCESSGPVPGLFNLISLGVVAVHQEQTPEGPRHRKGNEKYWELQLAYPGWEDEAEQIHRLSRERLAEKGLPPAQVMQELREWTLEQCAKGEKPVFVGHNAPFDWMYVNYYFHAFDVPNPYGYNGMDTKAYAGGKHRLLWPDTSKEKLLELYPRLEAPPEHLVHDALVDARFQADILIALLDD